MSTLCGEVSGRQPGLTTPSLTAMLVVVALSLWLVVIPLELMLYAERVLPVA